jgi:hypothetical protein
VNSNRKPGAQKGNRNAYKHGFYAANFSPAECKKLKRAPDLESELNAARIIADRIMNRITGKGLAPADAGAIDEETIHSINTLANVWGAISTLARSHQLVAGKFLPVETAILEALRDINIVDGYEIV